VAATGALLALTAASAAAATFAPVGANFQATAGPISIANNGISPYACTSSSFTGSIANPASSTASASAPSFAPTPCPMSNGFPLTATVTSVPSGWQLSASSTSQVRLVNGSLGGDITITTRVVGNPTVQCVQYLEFGAGMTGAWSNATRKLTFTNAPVPYITSNGLGCPAVGVPSGSGTVFLTGTYTLANTTNPANPITVLP
jgi:hypothetical protein